MSDLNVYTTAQINALTPITGDMVVDSDLNAVKLYDGSAWRTWNSDSTAAPYQNRWGASFDGLNDYLEVPHTTDLELTTAMTWSAWVNMNTTHTTDYPYLFAKWNSGNTAANYTFYTQIDSIPSGYFVMRYWDSSSAQPSSTNIPRGQWVHLAAVHNGTQLTYYVNGVADNTINVTTGSTNTGNLIIGRAPNGVRTFPGEIDEAAIFNSALSASDVSSIYNNGVPTDISSLSPVGYWRMGDDSNDSATAGGNIATITDSSGNGNDATQSTASNQPTFSDLTPPPFENRWGASFDGLNDYLDLGTVSAFNNDPSAFSISIWFYGSQISIGGFSNRGVGFYTYNTDFYVHAGMLGSLSMSNPFNSSAWNHALLTYNKSGDTKFYVNGNTTPSLSAASANGLASIQAGNTYSIGRYTHYALYRAGLIDEVAIFTTELSTADLTKIYNSGVPTDLTLAASYDTANQEQNLAGYWRMGDDSNDSPVDAGNITGITDSSGNGNDATQSTASAQPTFSDRTGETIYV